MLFVKGSRVRFIYTGEEGVVVDLLENNMLNVELTDGEVIPAFAEDLIRIEDEKRPPNKPAVKAKSVPGKTPKVDRPPTRKSPESQYTILKSKGIQLGFEERKRADGTTDHYLVHLINDTRYDVLYTYMMDNPQHTNRQLNGKLDRLTAIAIDQLPFDRLNESPVIQMTCWQLTTEGTGPKLSKAIKIKPQQFFKKLTTAPILDIPVHLYIVFDQLDPDEKKDQEEDLKSYTRRKTKEQSPQKQTYTPRKKYDTKAFAEFNNELDLHIENLTDNPHGMSNADILHLQMRLFEDYMRQAIRLGVPRVFIIHGVGKGRLRKEIARWLDENPYVISHKNEYHHRFGYGATEVEL